MEYENNSKLTKKFEKELKNNLFDQDFVIDTLLKTLAQSNLLKKKRKVRAFFTFIGSANTGKHYLCELLLNLNPEIKKLKTFYMDQYSGTLGLGVEEISSVSFKNEVIDFVSENPNSILLFEDIEKAELTVQLALYSIFTDYENNEADFSNVIVVITTTILSQLLQRKDFKTILAKDTLQAHTFLMERLDSEQILSENIKENLFDKKLLSLLNEHTIIPFSNLSINALIKIGARSLNQMSKDFIKENKISIEYIQFDKFISLLTLSLSPYINARHIKQKIPKLIFNNIYDTLKLEDNIIKICYSLSKKAEAFVLEAMSDEPLLFTKISKQHMRVTLEWKISIKNNTAYCVINNAFFALDELNVIPDEIFNISDITFDDIAGQKKVKDELIEIVTILKEPERLKHFDLLPPKGMILSGPSGMGKKILARAFAHEVNIPYTVINGSNLFDRNSINKAYEQAYSSAPAIIILEDIHIQGIIEGMISTMSLEPLLDKLDSLNQSYEAPIFTIITINSNANIPPELLHSQRIPICIEIPKLDMEARRFFIEEILKKPHDKKIDIQRVVRYISGMGGNELKRIGEESSLYAARKGLKKLTEEILLEQINIIKYGTKLENKQIKNIEKSMAKTAYHEAGHAVLSYTLLPDIKIEQVTVAPRSQTLGFVSYHNEDYVDATSKEQLFNSICVCLAGRIAKMEKFGEEGMETGAVNDLEIATMQVYATIALFGMDEELGYINISCFEDVCSKQLFQEKIEDRILLLMDKAKQTTESEVKRLWKPIEAVAQTLIKKEMIDGEELKNIIESNY